VLAATGAGVAYALSGVHTGWLWVASTMLVLNWFGDSLDGTLARVRFAERPRYGYYLDHVVDAYATAAIGIGLGLSPFVSLGVALGLVVVYLVLSINVYLESAVFGAFRLGYGRLGPTEVRLMLIAVNAGLALHHLVPGLTGVESAWWPTHCSWRWRSECWRCYWYGSRATSGIWRRWSRRSRCRCGTRLAQQPLHRSKHPVPIARVSFRVLVFCRLG
jgi:phosphatidylglycerophosphate synthase